MSRNQSNVVFSIFDEGIAKKGYRGTTKFTKKELGKMFDTEIKNLGENIGNCEDLNLLQKRLGLSYVREDGGRVDGPFITKDFKFEEIEDEKNNNDKKRNKKI